MSTEIGICNKNSKAVANELTKILEDEYMLYNKTRNAHWNISGSDFYIKHKFFETQFGQLDEFIDSIAESIRYVGHYSPSTLKSFLELKQPTEMTREKDDWQGFIRELLCDHESIIIKIRKNIRHFDIDFKDAGSSDFITGLKQGHEKMAWFLKSHLQ